MKLIKNKSWKFLCLLFVILLLTACGKTSPSSTDAITQIPYEYPITATPYPAQTDEFISLGYYTGSQDSYDSFLEFVRYLDIVSVDVYGLNFDGTIVGTDTFDIAAQFASTEIEYYACISNWNSDPEVDNFDPELARVAILTYQEEVISQLVALAQTGGYAGINIDFENIAYTSDLAESRTAFNNFIHELAARLHEKDKKLIISVAAKVSDNPNNEWSYPFDLEALAKDADYLQLMTYDQHGSWGGPGSVSGADWLEEVVAYTTSIADPSKLLIGLPAYGYDWNLSIPGEEEGTYTTTSFSWVDIPKMLDRPGAKQSWDDASHSPYITYSENGHDHTAWFENVESIQTKVNLIPQYNLAGLSVWALGMEDLDFWQATLLTAK